MCCRRYFSKGYGMENSSESNNELDQYGVWVKTPPHSEQEAPVDPAEFDSKTNGSSEPTSEETVETPAAESPSPETSPLEGLADGEVSLDEFLEGSSNQDDGEISIDSFLGDSESTDSDKNFLPDGEISLDDFLDSSDLSSGPQETQESYDEPLDIDLTFEDVEVETEEGSDLFDELDDLTAGLSGSSGSSSGDEVDLSAFLSDDAPSVQTDKTTAEGESVPVADFDEFISDETPPSAKQTSDSVAQSEDVDLSEFGIGGDDNPGMTISSEAPARKNTVQDYELSVDDNGIDSEPETISAETEDSLTLEMDNKSNSAALKPDEQNPYSAPDDDFDLDSLLDSIEDENGNSVNFDGKNDKATEIGTSAPAEKKSPATEGAVVEDDVFSEVSPEIEENVSEKIPVEENSSGFEDNIIMDTEPSFDETDNEAALPAEDNASTEVTEDTVENAAIEEPSAEETPSEYIMPSEDDATSEEKAEEITASQEIEAAEDSISEETVTSEDTVPIDNTVVEETDNADEIDFSIVPAEKNEEYAEEVPETTVTESLDNTEFEEPDKTFLPEDLPVPSDPLSDPGDEEIQESVDLSDFMGDKGFSDPSIAEGNRSYSPEELAEQEKNAKNVALEEETVSNEEINNVENTDENDSDEIIMSEVTEDESPAESATEDLFVDAAEGQVTNGVIDDEDVVPSPFYEPLVENEGNSSVSLTDVAPMPAGEISNGEAEAEDSDPLGFISDIDSIVPASMDDIKYDEESGIISANDSDETVSEQNSEEFIEETVAENENKSDNRINGPEDSDSPADEETTVTEPDETLPAGAAVAAVSQDDEESREIPVTAETTPADEERMDNTNILTNEGSSSDNGLLNQIAHELSVLKEEINELKIEFAALRNNGVAAADQAVSTVSEDKEAESGFFSDMDDDDTIALSGDELSNILNNAEFTAEEATETVDENEEASTAEEPVNTSDDTLLGSVENAPEIPEQDYEDIQNDLSVDFSGEKLQEPDLDSVEISAEPAQESEETLPDEIEVPRSDDILVEPSDSGFESDFEEPVSRDIPETEDFEPEESVAADTVPGFEEPVPEEESVPEEPVESAVEFEETAVEESSKEPDFSEPVISDEASEDTDNTITNEDFDYLSNETVPEIAEEDERLEPGISEEPQKAVFNTWENASPEEETLVEPEIDETPVEAPVEPELEEPSVEPESEETTVAEEPEAAFDEQPVEEPVTDDSYQAPVEAEPETTFAPAASSSGSIPEDMKAEIKSVLAYMDQLLESLPEDKIAEFAKSEQFATYKKLFSELGLS